MRGPMLQRLLEDRFKVKIHREIKETPVYDLTVAKGGPKLHPLREGSCIPTTLPLAPRAPPPAGQKFCRVIIAQGNGPNMTMDAQGLSLSAFSKLLVLSLDRPVIDKTRITGLFDFQMEYGEDGMMVPVGADPNVLVPRPRMSLSASRSSPPFNNMA